MDFTRIFTWDDQHAFATLSGDANPIHMEPTIARRTVAGACLVHGVQSLLWMLEQASHILPLADLVRVDANFAQFLYIGEAVALTVSRTTSQQAKLELRTQDRRVSVVGLRFGSRQVGEPCPDSIHSPRNVYGMDEVLAENRSWDEVTRAEGYVAYHAAQAAVRRTYPRLAAGIGLERVTAIVAVTRLVGMVSPGLHSTFHKLSITCLSEPVGLGMLHYATMQAESRFQLVTMSVRAPGISGSVVASRRSPPIGQASSQALREHVAGLRFDRHRALVVGGSRGLGELTAKLLAMSGVETTITYASGRDDAEAIVADIRAAGGTARAIRLDVLDAFEDLPSRLGGGLTSKYFFATCRIGSNSSSAYSPERFEQFSRFYVDAFYRLCVSLAQFSERLEVFYPSSVFVSNPTKGMREYAMAKAAGEVLAADLTRFDPRINVETVRLPRLPTDQTVGLIEQEMGSALAWILPIIERVEGRVAGRSL